MTISGAKGGPVNFAQISCLLGQQELEGRRVPRMPSGKTLPCFDPYDTCARAGGYISDRFLTGIRPQEYYFHCMAGREGLVDTAVKTSRSGYLQRCLVKNLESLTVAYDATVRDCDGGVVQFLYGEDGLDVSKTAYLRQFSFLAANVDAVTDALAAWTPLLEQHAADPQAFGPASMPAQARFPPHSTLNAVGEAYGRDLDAYVSTNPDGLLAAGAQSLGGQHLASGPVFRQLMRARHMRALASPGEAVGVLAAQSVGEPSTQMTLNTFHFAGRGEANVTLGIPRLRELLMAAAKKIGTPVMVLPVANTVAPQAREAAAKVLAARLRRVTLAELVDTLTITETPFDATGRTFCRSYTVTCCLRTEADPRRVAAGSVSFPEAALAFKMHFTRHLLMLIKAELTRASSAEATQIRAVCASGQAVGARQARDDDHGDAMEEAPPADDEEDKPAGQQSRREAGSEIGEESDGEGSDEDGEEEGAKAHDRRTARHGEEYAAPEAADEDAQQQDGVVAAGQAIDEPGATQMDDDDGDAESGEDGDAPVASKRGGARGSGHSDLLTKLEAAQASCVEIEATRTVSCTLRLKLDAPKLLMLSLAQRAAVKCEVRVTPGIRKVYVLQDDRDSDKWRIQTDGINFLAANCCGDIADVNATGSNDVYAVLNQYGVEAARATLLAEVRAVFNVYGIGVDARHLSLIADAMTHTGGYRPCSRVGLDSCPSPLLKMSFETATTCVTDATLRGATDQLRSPSARLVAGRLVDCGTAVCGLQYDLARARQLYAERLAKAR